MDERELILDAIKQKKTNTSKVDFDFPEPCVIEKWAKRKKKLESFKTKPIEEWGNVEFLRYLDYMLKEFGVARAKGNVRSDSEKINHLYDRLVKQIPVMSNLILKEFIEWWCSIWAPRLTGTEFHLNLLIQDYQIARFANRYKKEEVAPIVIQQPASAFIPMNDDSIYDLGGLSLLLMKRGLVVGWRVLKKRGISDAMSSSMMQKTTMKFSGEILANVFKITLQGSLYPACDKVDFISLAKPALNRLGLTEYTQVSYGTHFKE